MSLQQTIASEVMITGVGLHSGKNVTAKLKPAEEFTGIVIHRTDEPAGSGVINICADAVANTQLCTELKNEYGVKVSTVEHLMAALFALQIDNIIVEIDGPELPILDGSSVQWVELIDKAGIKKQADKRQVIKILKEVVVKEGNVVASVKPSGSFNLHVFVHYGEKVPPMSMDYTDDEYYFRFELARARTFCFEEDVKYMEEMGLIKGGSVDNALVMDKKGKPVNGKLRYKDEVLRHKALDCMGDLYMSGYRIMGNFNVTRPGHDINNRLLRAILENKENWKFA